ncbi:MAG: 5-formyltetrahydrofolate cyclo-ligase [Pseudomonadota bacterium]
MTKAELRATMKAVRAAIEPGDTADRLARHADRLPPGLIAAYRPIRNEIDPLPLALSRGETVALPVTEGPIMEFRAWRPGEPLTEGAFGILEPTGPMVRPDVLLVPLLAFTRGGARLGYGAGHYDRYLSAHGGVPIGVAYAAQEVPSLPVEAHDVPLEAVATEAEFIQCKEGACA